MKKITFKAPRYQRDPIELNGYLFDIDGVQVVAHRLNGNCTEWTLSHYASGLSLQNALRFYPKTRNQLLDMASGILAMGTRTRERVNFHAAQAETLNT